MKEFFEVRKNENEILVRRRANYDFPLHFHLDLEVVLVRCGRLYVNVNGREYVAEAGSVLAMDSYDIHGYEKNEQGDDCVVVIPFRYLSGWEAKRKGGVLASPLIENGALCDELLSIVDEYLQKENSAEVREAAVRLFLARLSEGVQFLEKSGRDERVLVRKILGYVQAHYREDASLKRLARELGYAQEHISRVFHRYVKKSISEYVNGLRLTYIAERKRAGDGRKMAELIYDSGFKSLQTYYRCLAKTKM
ncbi:MAG: helix-turn-helix transcriptional regulator [Clostridia bacterium]|nr:helix-turn-helix transcriptional regulator [Clostridia bacterium]